MITIYRCINNLNGDDYIGQTQKPLTNRISQHKYSSKSPTTYFHNALNKYGWDNFTWEVLYQCESDDTQLADELEMDFIRECSPVYNLTEGGRGAKRSGKHSYTINKYRITVDHESFVITNLKEWASGNKFDYDALIKACDADGITPYPGISIKHNR